ncbi:MAG: putative phosphoesterase [Myxococcaceae bacterium]|nr:putative phosphoesterase [Myxococcaceae bacterium]
MRPSARKPPLVVRAGARRVPSGAVSPSTPRRAPALNAWRRRFLARVLGSVAVMQAPAVLLLAAALRDAAGWSPPACVAAAVGLHLAGASVLVHRLRWWVDDVRSPWWQVWLLEMPYAVYASGCFLAAPVAWLALAAFAIAALAGHPLGGVLGLLGPVYAVAGALSLWGTTVGRAWARVNRVEVPVAGLPAEFDGYRIAHVSDVHCGPYVPAWMLVAWARRVRSLDADLVALTGDLITVGEGYLDDVTAFARGLAARDGVVACMGNHDYFQSADGVVRALAAAEVTLLRNASTRVTRDGATLHLAGVDDRWTHRDDAVLALRDVPPGGTVVMLAHDPTGWPELARLGVALTLSGHTHGGQFGLPLGPRLNLGRLASRFSAGLFRERRRTLFVSRGIGTTGVPTRVGMAPEIALLVLRRV